MLGRPSSQAADPVAVRLSYVTFYDQRGGGIETSLKGDKQGLGRTSRNKKRGSRATDGGAAWLFGPQCGGLGASPSSQSSNPTLRYSADGA